MIRRVAVLGSAGSIGVQALEVVRAAPERLAIAGLATGRDLDTLCAQAAALRPKRLALEHADDSAAARARLSAASPGAEARVGPGSAAWLAAEAEADVVLNGIVGAAGLAPSLAALDAGRRLALANKETLVIGGPLVRDARARTAAELVPVDSEHSAVLQCLGGLDASGVERVTLTASGGALRDRPDWRSATRAEVLDHPVWRMGPRITVDSALLVNKAFERIEACWLFDLPFERVDAVLHRQGIVHAIVAFRDGATILQAAPPDMRLPIQLALSWPERWPGVFEPIAPESLAGLSFEPLRAGRFPAYDLACAAGREGGTMPCALNAADEVAVAAFLDGAIGLGEVPAIVERVLARHRVAPVESLAQLEEVDAWARAEARGQAVRA